MRKVDIKTARLAIDCIVESLTIMAENNLIDVDITLNFTTNNDLQGLKHYLEAIRKKGEKA